MRLGHLQVGLLLVLFSVATQTTGDVVPDAPAQDKEADKDVQRKASAISNILPESSIEVLKTDDTKAPEDDNANAISNILPDSSVEVLKTDAEKVLQDGAKKLTEEFSELALEYDYSKAKTGTYLKCVGDVLYAKSSLDKSCQLEVLNVVNTGKCGISSDCQKVLHQADTKCGNLTNDTTVGEDIPRSNKLKGALKHADQLCQNENSAADFGKMLLCLAKTMPNSCVFHSNAVQYQMRKQPHETCCVSLEKALKECKFHCTQFSSMCDSYNSAIELCEGQTVDISYEKSLASSASGNGATSNIFSLYPWQKLLILLLGVTSSAAFIL
eukprot:Nk52_evm19s621 gene=Nk52_evmTU19s621